MLENDYNNKIIYVPLVWNKYSEKFNSLTSKSGNSLFTKLFNATKKFHIKSTTDRVVEYELVPTGRVFNNKGEEINE